ncbi:MULTISPECIES: IS21 family transposase [unclassified Cryobacterium]|uniref:IS21 family transposase n=1 Tax=unclassified Cryobacterium TaxID=2649013 RepID=UPI002AB33E7B|nr:MULTISPECIES: IS21 family transposase [Cryobacterium]MDY7529968.1 IS21 family transposase [Cryobacterium sp. 10C2]MDY7544503.1 IS21 family transposase [Cryobacterium sp. 5B3]MDY7557894.1 IS21 family transposase [Cryobacterium sp. 10C3]MEB0002523.1 IS21 family transposase [Cryobacterium sp. RTC2.1]MEB0203303.1 IS21 family transposase [Cryobacterium sp. 5I3]
MESRVEIFAQIRRDARVEGVSIRELARRYGVGRPTVRQALLQAEPLPRKPRVRSAPRLDAFKRVIDEMLRLDTEAPRKQKHTARRVFARLADEHGATDLSYSTVRNYVRRRRPEIDAAAGRLQEVFVPQEHAPGAEAEVDFGEVWVILAGVKTKCHMFTFRLSHSGKAIHRVYPTQAQEAFLEGHIDAFEDIGGIPTRHIRYDNLTDAVVKVIYGTGRQRTENDRWVLFRSHYGFDAFYCHPGIEGAHEKGGVEGEVGRFRRTHLSPMPVVDCLEQLNERIRGWDLDDENRRISDRIRTVAQDFALERPLLAPVTADRFEPGLSLTPRVNRSSLIRVRMASYSVPARFIGRPVRVALRASEVIVFDGRTEIARHPRVVALHGQSVNLDHYLEVLQRKPGALPGSTALAHARASGAFTSAHEAFWAAARKTDGDAGGTKALIDVLLLHRTMATNDVVGGIMAALTVGAVTADVVAVEARRHEALAGTGRPPVEEVRGPERRVVSLTQRRLADPAAVIAGLPADTRPLPSVFAYDQLLRLPDRTTPPTAVPAGQKGTGS